MIRLLEDKNFYIPPPVSAVTSFALTALRWWVPAVCLIALLAGMARGAGTTAGTPVTSTAEVNYSLGADPTVLTATAATQFQVLEVINVSLTWQDAANVPVATPQTDRVLTFLLTNTGNGPESFSLNADNALAGDQFNPAVQSIWIESNGTAGLQSDDTPNNASGVALPADGYALIYVVGGIPAGLADGDTGAVKLSAAAMTSGAAGQTPGTLLPGAGDNAVDAVVGISRARSEADGAYEVASVTVTLAKSIVRISDPFGGDRPYTGARVTYRITVDVSGAGTAEALTISDPVPSPMTYAVGSIMLDGTPRTDADDGDQADFNLTAAGTVTVSLGDTVAPATHIIEFDTTIN